MASHSRSSRPAGRFRSGGGRILLASFAALLLVTVTAACGDDGDSSSTDSGDDGAPASDAYPVTIEHAFGEAVIDSAPERVVTWGWASTDAAIALGVVPVAIPFEQYAGDDEGVLPWIREALEEEGAELPTILPNSEGAPVEAIAAARPDLILAPYSGLTDQEYELLAKIAPTVAYPGEAWATPWRDVITTVGEALGRSEAADALLQDIDDDIAAKAAEHPEFEGKSVAMVWDVGTTFYVYKEADPRVEFVQALGFVNAPSVEQLASGEQTFFYTLSYEQLGSLTSDVLVSFADNEEAAQAFLTSSSTQLLPQIEAGTVASIVGTEFVSSVSPPTALSLTWGLDEYVEALAAAAKAAG